MIEPPSISRRSAQQRALAAAKSPRVSTLPRRGRGLTDLRVTASTKYKPLRRRVEAPAPSGPRLQRLAHVVGRPLTAPDHREAPDHRPHLVVKEAPRRRRRRGFPRRPAHLESVERLHRAVRLAVGGAEGREVVPSDQMGGALLHRLSVQRHGDMPHPPGIQCRRRPAIKDAVEIPPPDTREARVPVVGNLRHIQHRHRLRPHQRVQSFAQPMRRKRLLDIDMRAHRQRVNSGVGPPGGGERRAAPRSSAPAPPPAPAGPTAHGPAAASP